MHLPAVATELITFYVNPGERVTSGLKLADLKKLTSNLLITRFHTLSALFALWL